MRLGPARWAFASAALALAVAGCDYWDNLTTEKAVTRARLSISVIDGWRGYGVAGAFCRDTARGIAFYADRDGNYTIDPADTGPYAFICNDTYYLDTRYRADLGRSGGRWTIPLDRKGGKGWYTDSMRVALPRIGPQLRFPLRLDWTITPTDNRWFRFEWSFARTPRLNRGQAQPGVQPAPEANDPRYLKDVNEESGVREGPDTLRLKVFAQFGQDSIYEVGEDSAAFTWVRNRPPILSVLNTKGPTALLKVGCENPDGTNEGILILRLLEATDPDSGGSCTHVEIFSRDPLSALGKLDTSFPCTYAKDIQLRLGNPYTESDLRNRTSPLIDSQKVFARAWDDNGQYTEVAIPYLIRSNVYPKAALSLVHPNRVYFEDDTVRVRFMAKDTDGPVLRQSLNWGEAGNPAVSWDPFDPGRDQDRPQSVDTTLFHIYHTAGNAISIQAYATDNCGDADTAQIRNLAIYKDTPPVVQISELEPRTVIEDGIRYHKFRIDLRDYEVDNGWERFQHVYIDWGDSVTTDERDSVSGQSYVPRHHYAGPPASGNAYRVKVTVYDGHNKSGKDSLSLPYE